MQEAGEDEVDADLLVLDDAVGDLFESVDELGAEAVEVLAVGEVPVGVFAAVDASGRGVSALEVLRVGRPSTG